MIQGKLEVVEQEMARVNIDILGISKLKCSGMGEFNFSSVQSLSRIWLFVTPWTASCQASLSITNSRSSLRLMSIKSVMPSSHLILSHPLLLLPPIPPSIKVFSNGQLFAWGGHSTGASALASFFPKNTQGWTPSEWTGWISLKSKGLSRVFSNTTIKNNIKSSWIVSL